MIKRIKCIKYLQLNKGSLSPATSQPFQNVIARSVRLIPSFLARFDNLNPFSRTRRGFSNIGRETDHKLF